MPGFFDPVSATFVQSILTNYRGFCLFQQTNSIVTNIVHGPNNPASGSDLVDKQLLGLVDIRCKSVIIQVELIMSNADLNSNCYHIVTQQTDGSSHWGPFIDNKLGIGGSFGTSTLHHVSLNGVNQQYRHNTIWNGFVVGTVTIIHKIVAQIF